MNNNLNNLSDNIKKEMNIRFEGLFTDLRNQPFSLNLDYQPSWVKEKLIKDIKDNFPEFFKEAK